MPENVVGAVPVMPLASEVSPRPRPRAAPRPVSEALWKLRPGAIWGAVRREPAAFWLLNIYYFFEYVRPQSVYESLSVIPWSTPILLLAAISVPASGIKLRMPTVLGRLLVVFTVLILISAATAWSPGASLSALGVWFNWVLVFVLTCSVVTTERRLLIFMLGFFLYNFKMSQHGARGWMAAGFGFVTWGNTGAPGWFQNSGDFGVEMCIFFPLATTFVIGLWKRWSTLQRIVILVALPLTAIMSVVGSSSRGALIGTGAVLVWFVARSRYRVRAAVAAAIVAILIVAVVPAEFKDRFRTAGNDQTSQQRFTVWGHGRTIVQERPLTGIGYSNWSPYSADRWGSALQPHNIFIQAAAEEGIPAGIVFVAMIVATFVVNYRSRKLLARLPADSGFLRQLAYGLDGALIGYLGSGFWVSVLYWPCFWVNLAMTASLYLTVQNKARTYGITPGSTRQRRKPRLLRPTIASRPA